MLGLFNQMVALGGSALTRAAINDQVVDVSHELIYKVGCAYEEREKMLNCLKGKTVDELYAGTTIVSLVLFNTLNFELKHFTTVDRVAQRSLVVQTSRTVLC